MCNKEKQMKLNLYESKCFNYRNITGEESFHLHPQQVFRQVGHRSSWWWVRNVITKVQMSRCSMYFWKCLRWENCFQMLPKIYTSYLVIGCLSFRSSNKPAARSWLPGAHSCTHSKHHVCPVQPARSAHGQAINSQWFCLCKVNRNFSAL